MSARAVAGIGRSTGKQGEGERFTKENLRELRASVSKFDQKHGAMPASKANGQQWINLYLKVTQAVKLSRNIELTPGECAMWLQVSTNAEAGRRISGAASWLQKFFESNLWRRKAVFDKADAWLDMYGMGMGNPEGVSITKGRELATSIRFLATRWGWDKMAVKRFLVELHETNRVETTFESRRTVIRICVPSVSALSAEPIVETTGNLNARTSRPDSGSL